MTLTETHNEEPDTTGSGIEAVGEGGMTLKETVDKKLGTAGSGIDAVAEGEMTLETPTEPVGRAEVATGVEGMP